MKKYSVRNTIQIETTVSTVRAIMQLLVDRKLVSIPQFLQRTLLKEKWFKNDYKNSKQYNISIFKGQGKLDSITIVHISILIAKIKKTISSESNTYVKKSLEKGLEILNQFKDNGAVYINLDGQSRLILGIQEYAINNTFPLGEEAGTVILDVTTDGNTEESSDLVHSKFNELDTQLQNLYKEQLLTTNIIQDFYDFDDIIDALVNKQRGFAWSIFQQIKQKFRFTEFVVNLIDVSKSKLGELYQNYWSSNMHGNVKADYRTDVDGFQLFSIIGGYLMEKGTYPSDVDAIKQLSSPDPIKKTSIEKYMKLVTTKFFNFVGETKVGIPELVNFLVFKMILENGGNKKGTKPFTKDIRIPIAKNVIICNDSKLLDAFMLHHKRLSSKVGKNGTGAHEASWRKENGVYVKRSDGYLNYNSQQNNEYIKGRMKLFFKYFPFDQLVTDNVIKLVDDNSKKSFDELLVYRDGKDLLGEPISTSNFKKHDKSHGDATANGGSNEFENLVLELSGPNRSRGSKNLEIIN
jgi:hypothetical protein|tara:strand:+ start:428 stop:1990 length:1563 start_codon:yes stop_codon:yes gene_type:complete